jgi:CDP-diacylglycerol--serine O-phosphatidyltransferase
VPAPAGAIVALLPLHLQLSGLPIPDLAAAVVAVYLVLIAIMMVSRVPTYSGKKLGQRLRRDLVLPFFVIFVFAAALFVSFPFESLALLATAYLVGLPFGWRAWNRLARQHGQVEEEVVLDIRAEPVPEPAQPDTPEATPPREL